MLARRRFSHERKKFSKEIVLNPCVEVEDEGYLLINLSFFAEGEASDDVHLKDTPVKRQENGRCTTRLQDCYYSQLRLFQAKGRRWSNRLSLCGWST